MLCTSSIPLFLPRYDQSPYSKSQKADAASILFLIRELAIFEKEPQAVIVTQAQIEKTVLEPVLYLNVL